ncbi:MAG: DinB family protein [Phycisphaerales bacterium]|nr:DinB family protein [Phycisphaerales bacterium]
MTPSTDFVQILLSHNHWANGQVLDRAGQLTEDEFHRRFEIGPGSVHDAMRHIVAAMLRWADRIGERPLRASLDSQERRFSISELREHNDAATAQLMEVARGLSGESARSLGASSAEGSGAAGAAAGWAGRIEFRLADGTVYRFSKAASLAHAALHGQHHRTQVVNMFRQLGKPAAELDLDPIEWECALTGQIAPGG